MKNKGVVILLTIVITSLCLYYLSFTFISRNIQGQAIEASKDENGAIDQQKKQAYLDSIFNKPVYNLLGIEYTFKEIQETELNLGLDLEGGMHVVLEVSPVDIVKGLAGKPRDEGFNKAVAAANAAKFESNIAFSEVFYEEFQKQKPGVKLSSIFANSSNRDRINLNTSDQDILKIIEQEIENAIERSFIILRTRVDQFGTSQPNIQRLKGTGRIQVELPGVDNPERVRKLLKGMAELEFLELYDGDDLNTSIFAVNDLLMAEAEGDTTSTDTTSTTKTSSEDLVDLLSGSNEDTTTADTDTSALAEKGEDILDSLSTPQGSPLLTLIKVPGLGLNYGVEDTGTINRILKREDVKSMLPRNVQFCWDVKAKSLNDGTEYLELYPLKRLRSGKAPLSGDVITNAVQTFDQRGRPAVSMSMNATGAKKWKKLTALNINKRVAVVLDNYVYTAPTVRSEIAGGRSEISGNFDVQECKDLANILKAGALPAPTRIVEEAVIGPTLGKEAQMQGIISILAGLAIVVVFMVLYYAKGGMIANLALVFNVFFILGILANVNAALTLPGIAGIVLTIGMSIDANVLIFERIREELRNGSGLKSAISKGYEKAFSSIFDSNATTFLVCFILNYFGQGPVKGFAVTLMIGIACSFFSAVFITRVIAEWISKKGDESNLSFDMPFSKNLLNQINLDFISKRKVAYMVSLSFIALGIVAIIIKGGLNLGVDFKGGRSYVVLFNDNVIASEYKTALADHFEGTAPEVKTYNNNNTLKITTSYLQDERSADTDAIVEQKLINGIEKHSGLSYKSENEGLSAENFTIGGSSKVGATIADDIKDASLLAIIFSLVVIFFYIFIRFKKPAFGFGALAALFHDTLVVISAFSIANLFGISYEIDQVFIAAMLTIIGYSINDTVVVFDRIRETLGLRSQSDMISNFNISINNTISRTLITSFTTLIVVLILFIFGGEVLRGFSFALLVGIVVGTYSSIFIATPLVVDLSKSKN